MSDWSSLDADGKADLIRHVYRKGMGTLQIAAMIGVSKNAIVGVFGRRPELREMKGWDNKKQLLSGMERKHRKALGLPRLTATETQQRKRRTKRNPAQPQSQFDPAIQATVQRLFGAQKPLQRVKPSGAPAPLNLPLTSLGANMCRYAVNDAKPKETHLFCGNPGDGMYCDHHRGIVYVSKAELRRREEVKRKHALERA